MSYRRWEARCVISGTAYSVVDGLPTRTLSLSQRQSATMNLASLPPGNAVGLPGAVDVAVDGVWERFFTGVVAPYSQQIRGGRAQLTLTDVAESRDVMDQTTLWDKTPFDLALRAVAARCGIEADLIDIIENPLAGYDPGDFNGATYTLGDRGPVEVSERDGAWDVLQELLAFGGMRLWFLPSGHIRVVINTSVPRDTTLTVFASDPGPDERGIYDAGVTRDGTEHTLASYFASGPTPKDGSVNTARSTRGDGPITSESFRFAEWAWACKLISDRELARRARNAVPYWFEAPLDLRVIPGMTLGIRDATVLRTGGVVRGVVTDVASTEQGTMRVTLTTGESLISGSGQTAADGTNIHTPIPDWAGMVLSHPDGVIVECVGQSFSPIGATITAHEWEATGNVPVTHPRPTFALLATFGVLIDLTVTDSEGREATVTRRALDRLTARGRRTLALARGGDGWRLWYDGTWREWVHAAACTAVLNDPAGALPPLAGFADGTLWRSPDYLFAEPDTEPVPTLHATLTGAISAITPAPWHPETVIVAHGPSVSLVTLTGAVQSLGTVTEPVTALATRPASATILACAGATAWRWHGGDWQAIAAAPTGGAVLAAIQTRAGHTLTLVSAATLAEAIQGATVDWAGVDLGDLPTALASLAVAGDGVTVWTGESDQIIPDPRCSGVVWTRGAGRVYRLDWTGTAYAASLVATAPAGLGAITDPGGQAAIDVGATVQLGLGTITAMALPSPEPEPGGVLLMEEGGALLMEEGGALLMEEGYE